MMEFDIILLQKYIFKQQIINIKECELKETQDCFLFLENFQQNKVIYGINTGFGPMAQYRINDKYLNELQYNIIRSHSCAMGEPIDEYSIRGAMLSRINTFLKGKSGVHPDTIKIMQEFLNHNICPVVPEHGSVGASGDLVQLSHIASALIGEGEVFFNGKRMKAIDAMIACDIKPLKMYIREGLALTNGTAVMTGVSLVNTILAQRLLEWSVLASVLINEVASSYDDFMSETLNGLKKHKGQQVVAQNMRNIVSSSHCLLKREDVLYSEQGANKEQVTFKHKVQPYYSLRCIPQILGPILDALQSAEQVVMDEFDSVDDNPIIDPHTNNIYHGGNFHGDYISFEMDKLKIAVTKMVMLMERQINYLFHDRINEILPPFCNLGVLGLNYGLQAAQFTATSTTAECQTLSNPMYVHSIPNNNDNQDVVSMGTNSALLARRVIENGYQVMAVEMMALAQAVDALELKERLSVQTRKLYDDIRTLFPKLIEDRPLHQEMEQIVSFLKQSHNVE